MPPSISLVVTHGTLILFAATLAARIGAPVPAAPFLVIAGALAAAGQVSWWAALAAAIVASMLGDGLWFWGGRRYGYRVLRLLCRISISPDSCVRESESFILRWGGSSLIAAKFVPGVSLFAPPMAGALGMPLVAFLGFELLGAVLWAGVFLSLGWTFADQLQQLLTLLASIGTAVVAAVVVVLLVYLAARYRRRRLFLGTVAMPRIGVAELRAMVDGGSTPVIVDVRSAAARRIDARRLPGAIAAELSDIEHRMKELPHDGEVVLYCNCPNEASAAQAASLLASRGFTRVRPLAGGLDAWVAAGHGVDSHAQVMPVGADVSEVDACRPL